MKNITLRSILILAFFLIILLPKKIKADFVQDDAGIQKIHTQTVPQINSSGKIQYSYTADSFFPLGMYWFNSNYLQQIKDAGFNLVYDADWTIGSPMPISRYSLLNQYGIKVTPLLHDAVVTSVTNNNWSTLSNLINSIKNNPAVLAYYLTHEQYSQISSNQWLDGYNHVKALDPDRAIMGEQGVDYVLNFPRSCFPLKVDMSNIYSYTVMNEAASLSDLTKVIDGYMGSGCPWPLFVILQVFKGDSWPVMPSPEQVRAQMYTAITHGATGLWLFVGFPPQGTLNGPNTGLWPGTSQWNAASQSNHEIETYKKIYLSKTSTDEYHVFVQKGPRTCISITGYCQGCGDPRNCHEFDDDLNYCAKVGGCGEDNGRCSGTNCQTNCSTITDRSACINVNGCSWPQNICTDQSAHPVHTILKDAGESGVRYLLAVNLDIVPLDGKFAFSQNPIRVTSILDNRSISPSNNGFTDSFPGYAVRLYKIDTNQTYNTPTPTQPSCSLKRQGDANCDGKVDMTDYYYLVLALNGGETPPSVNPDFNGDGEIGLSDRSIIVKTLQAK